MGASLFRLPGWGRLASRFKLALRRIVVVTSVWPLTAFYDGIYKLHVWYALRILKKLPRVRAVYLARGAASSEIVYGVSDIDLVVLGDWSGEQHEQAMQALRRLSRLSPLYDRMLWQHAHTVEAMHNLYETDFWFQYRFDQGRQWKLLHGENLLAALPPVSPQRLAGGYYMEIRNWWGTFHESALGFGVTAKDLVFRNSIAYKTVGEIVSKTSALHNGIIEHSRKKAINQAVEQASGADRAFLERLRDSARDRHLDYDGDIEEDTWRFLLRQLEECHLRLGSVPPFQPIPNMTMHVDAPLSEVLRTRPAEEQAREVIQHVKREWPGYRAAFLLPSVSFLNLDDLMLLLEVDPQQPPSVRQVRNLCRMHIDARRKSRQRVALLLLLRQGAVQLETVSLIELWHLVISSPANPDVFALLSRAEFALDGNPRAASDVPQWTEFAAALIDEELGVRRAAMSNVNADPSMSSLELVRNLWRHMQLEVIQRTTAGGQALIPLTPAAIQRAFARWGITDTAALDGLCDAYAALLEGRNVDVRPLIPQLASLFSRLQ